MNRFSHQIIAEMLSCCQRPSNKWHIRLVAELPGQTFNRYWDYLQEKDLLTCNGKEYSLTEKGTKALACLQEFLL